MGFKTRYDGRVFYTEDDDEQPKNNKRMVSSSFISDAKPKSKSRKKDFEFKYVALRQYIPYKTSRCPICGDEVFFIRHNGGCMYFDPPLGWPWPRHACFDDQDYLNLKQYMPTSKSQFGIISKITTGIRSELTTKEDSPEIKQINKTLQIFQKLLLKYHRRHGLDEIMYHKLLEVLSNKDANFDSYLENFDFHEILKLASKISCSKAAKNLIKIHFSLRKSQSQKIYVMTRMASPYNKSFMRRGEFSTIQIEVSFNKFKSVKITKILNRSFIGEPVVINDNLLFFIRLNRQENIF